VALKRTPPLAPMQEQPASSRGRGSAALEANAKQRECEYENNLPIWICRGIKKPLLAIWPEIKTYE
jgi:hypothetical protein